ncbi:MAG TPA: phytanoyl-CoA dioxygenase family protein [Gemmatimonadales bacterium]|nr:phytanoyl-CoA dioxygenase family protein [Gemmatimonadales bacterium]
MGELLDPRRLRKAASRIRGKIEGRVGTSIRRWRYVLDSKYLRNPVSTRRLTSEGSHLTPVQQEALADLRARGIAFVSQERLGIDPADWRDLRELIDQFAASERVRDRIHEFPALAAQKQLRGDDYMVKLYPEGPTLPPTNPLLRIGLCPALLDVINHYLGLWSKLVYTDAWHTIPVDIGRRVGSQSWHRDPEDRRMVKAYLYCRDVDEGAGPMEYVPGSASGGPYADLWPWRPRGTHAERYPSDEEVAAKIPRADRITCTGRAGTFVLCDTDGLHRGGISTTSPRVLATWTFVTPAALGTTVQRRFTLASARALHVLSAAAMFALG